MKKKMIVAAYIAVFMILGTLAISAANAGVFYRTSTNTDNVLKASKEFISIKKNLPMFKNIRLFGICRVEIKYGEYCRIEVSGPENYVNNMSYKVKDYTLNVSMDDNYAYSVDDKSKEFPHIVIYIPELIKIVKCNLGDVSVSSDVQIENLWAINDSMSNLALGNIDCNSVVMDLKSGGSINAGDIKVNTSFTCKNSSMGNLILGTVYANKFYMSLSSGGNMQVKDIEVKQSVECKNSSMGKIKMNNVTCSNLEIELSSGGDIVANDIVCRENARYENSSMGEIKTNTIRCDNECDIYLSSGGDFTAYQVVANRLSCTSSSIGEIKIKNADVKKYSQNAKNGNVSINY